MFDPLLLNLSDRLRTDRLLLRPPGRGDGGLVFEAVDDSLSELRAFPASMKWVMQQPSLESSETWCRINQANWILRREMPLMVFRRDTERLVGMVGLHHLNWQFMTFEIGWWGRTSELGHGFITEAAGAVLDFAFRELKARRVFAMVDQENLPSLNLARRAGMRDEGVLRHERCDTDGTPRHMAMLARCLDDPRVN